MCVHGRYHVGADFVAQHPDMAVVIIYFSKYMPTKNSDVVYRLYLLFCNFACNIRPRRSV